MSVEPNVRSAPSGDRAPRRNSAETKPFYMTSEFMVLAAMTVSLFIASLVVDDLDSRLAWILGVSLVGAYILSRGIAKVGTRSTSYDPREDMHRDDLYRDVATPRERQTL